MRFEQIGRTMAPGDVFAVIWTWAAVCMRFGEERARRMGRGFGNRWLAATLAAGAMLLIAAPEVRAQDRWWESFPGFGAPDQRYRTSNEEGRRKPEPLNDLRPDATPFRSDVMIEALEAAIERYQVIVSNGGWPPIPGSRMIRVEDDDERLPYVRRRLMLSGELRRRRSADDGFAFGQNDDIEAAIRRYQENNGLRVTGRVDKQTLAALNVPAQARLQQLRINLQRLRELMTPRIEDRYVLVNAAAFQLEAVERYQVELRHRVIVGKPERQTPTVRATIKALNFFPYWRVPESVASLDLIPRLTKEPDYLQKEQIRVLTGSYNGPEIDATNIDWRQVDPTKVRFRQDPGPQNALGLVRLDMPNGVNQRGRAFSAGCVRVQDVFTLAEWVARYEPGWEQPGRAQEIVQSGQALDLNLTRPVPVYFAYISAWAEPDGRIIFRPDIYGRDGMRDLIGGQERDPDEGPAPRWTLAP
jgi:murein L,D-transpeptidase YcbB/YkuD